ncbi:ankyrin repeat domain-containing protein [Endozoicomonas sp. ONNA2]|uniref:ankyrin repeat domain-containing protein n=1 Tax=Endozoicomonas sp. ONNA2 TaxID=2828741 RepID=UPI0021497FAB|nr:ankyrin repeat domain-containing protein [Endozoicomonas sp. ONNA2]
MNNSYREICRSIAPLLDSMTFRQDLNPANNNGGHVRAIPDVLPAIGPGDVHLTRNLCVALERRDVVNLEQIQAYLAKGADLNQQITIGDLRDCNPLHSAAISGNVAAVTAIIASGQLANINAVDGHGFTPLALLCGAREESANFSCRFTSVSEEKSARLVGLQTLLGANADQHISDRNNYKPVHHAARHNFPELIKRLVKHYLTTDMSGAARPGDILNCPDRLGNTPLHIAARYNQADSTKALLDLGANANALNRAGQTPLHQLCVSKNNDNNCGGRTACLLLERVEDADLQDKKGKTWSNYAGQNGMAQLLRFVRNDSNSALSDQKSRAAVRSAAKKNVNTGRKSGISRRQYEQVFKFLKEPSTLAHSCLVVIRETLKQNLNADAPHCHGTSCMEDAVAHLPLHPVLQKELLDENSYFD